MRTLIITATIVLYTFVATAQNQQPTSLEACIERALDANYSIKIIRNTEKQSNNNVNYSPFLPNVSVNGNRNQSNYNTETTSLGTKTSIDNNKNTSLSAGVQLDWTIFDGLSMFATHSKLLEQRNIGKLNTRMAIENMILDVSSAYYNVIVQHSTLEAAKHTLDLSAERYKEAMDKYTIGVLSGLDAGQAKIDLNADSSAYMKQIEMLKGAYITLNTLIQNKNLQSFMFVNDSITLLPKMSFETLESDMLKKNVNLIIARKEQHLSSLDLKNARSLFFPTLTFTGGYNLSRTETPKSGTTLNKYNGPYWGLKINMSIFNRMETMRKVRNAKLDVENMEYSCNEAELQLRADLAQLYNTYENNLQIVSFEMENADVAFDNLDAAIEKYKLGTLSGIEFREFQRSYTDAVERKISAIYQAKISELSLQLVSGNIIEDIK